MFCFWCQIGKVPKNLIEKGFVWLHIDCLNELMNLRQDNRALREILQGKKNETVENYIIRMNDFDKKSKILMDKLKKL